MKDFIKKLFREGIELVNDEVNAFHGSPHDFDEFILDKMGSGEGEQFFGWGLYFTDLEDIAKKYKSNLSKKHKMELWVDDTTVENRISQYYSLYDRTNNNKRAALIMERIEFLEELNDNWDYEKAINLKGLSPKTISWANKDVKPQVIHNLGKFYKVTLHKGKTPTQYHWLNWYENIDSSINNKLITQAKKEGILKEKGDSLVISIHENWEASGYLVNNDITGDLLYNKLSYFAFSSDKEASLFLLRAGIDGIKYPAESLSSGVNSDTARGFNYVIFDPKVITIDTKQ